ncbi:MAG: hypothetical protein ACYDBQ_08735 [Thermoplasmatota archaeon]
MKWLLAVALLVAGCAVPSFHGAWTAFQARLWVDGRVDGGLVVDIALQDAAPHLDPELHMRPAYALSWQAETNTGPAADYWHQRHELLLDGGFHLVRQENCMGLAPCTGAQTTWRTGANPKGYLWSGADAFGVGLDAESGAIPGSAVTVGDYHFNGTLVPDFSTTGGRVVERLLNYTAGAPLTAIAPWPTLAAGNGTASYAVVPGEQTAVWNLGFSPLDAFSALKANGTAAALLDGGCVVRYSTGEGADANGTPQPLRSGFVSFGLEDRGGNLSSWTLPYRSLPLLGIRFGNPSEQRPYYPFLERNPCARRVAPAPGAFTLPGLLDAVGGWFPLQPAHGSLQADLLVGPPDQDGLTPNSWGLVYSVSHCPAPSGSCSFLEYDGHLGGLRSLFLAAGETSTVP